MMPKDLAMLRAERITSPLAAGAEAITLLDLQLDRRDQPALRVDQPEGADQTDTVLPERAPLAMGARTSFFISLFSAEPAFWYSI